jgi:hypothetical protein
VPSLRSAHVSKPPAAIVVASLIPVTGTGAVELVVVPLPSSPLVLSPQQRTMPSASLAQVWSHSALTAVALVMSVTGTGTYENLVVPSPSCPSPLFPQQRMVPPRSRAQEWLAPAVTATAVVMPLTVTGVVDPRVEVPMPSCPASFAPQHVRVPSRCRAQVCAPPPAIWVMGEVAPPVLGVAEAEPARTEQAAATTIAISAAARVRRRIRLDGMVPFPNSWSVQGEDRRQGRRLEPVSGRAACELRRPGRLRRGRHPQGSGRGCPGPGTQPGCRTRRPAVSGRRRR